MEKISPLLSVRTGFDLYLSALAPPQGGHVILTAINIPDMVTIVREHRLVPIPIDLDMESMEVDLAAFSSLASQKTVLLVVSHVFGSVISNLRELLLLAGERGIPVFEDCAEGFLFL